MSYLVGHQLVVDSLRQQQQNDHVPQSLLLVGPPNIGKSTVARFFMQTLNCQGEVKPCGQCLACRKTQSGNHPDLFIFDEGDDALKIETIRSLQRTLSLSPVEGQYRVALLCNFEQATTSAANALLKTLEEPPPQVVLMLTATDKNALLPTIVSRCQVLTLHPLPTAEVVTVLQERWQVSLERAVLLAQLATGRLGWAIRALNDEQFLERRQQSLQDLLMLLTANRADRLAYAYKLSQDTTLLKETLIFWITLTRDLLLLHNHCRTTIINQDWRDKLQPLATQLSGSKIKAMVVRLRDALRNLEYNVNPRLNLEVTLLKLPKIPKYVP